MTSIRNIQRIYFYSSIKMPSPFVNKDVEEIVCSTVQLLTNYESNAVDHITWLQKAPKLTTYRVNPLKADIEKLIKTIQAHLENQRKEYGWKMVPRVYQHFPDTIGVETWPEEDKLDKLLADDGLPSVIVDASCGSAVLRGANVFAPAVMGLPTGIGINDDVNIFADVSGDCKKGSKGDYTNGVRLFVGRGKLKMSRHELFGDIMKPRGIGVQTVLPVSKVPVIDQDILTPGDCLLQNLPSIICGKVLNPKPGETVLDMCAAPGNKTTHLAELMGNKGTIIAIDKIANKIDTIKRRCQESSITCVHPFAFDSTKAVLEDGNNSRNILEGPPFALETFDKILLDVPCSALGQRPLLTNKMTVKMLRSYVPLQRKLFQAAVKLLKPGGHLVYSTCTTTKEECETMVAWALATFPALTLIPAAPIYGNPGWPDSGLNDEQRLMVQRFGPGKDALRRVDAVYNDTIGFFISSFKKH